MSRLRAEEERKKTQIQKSRQKSLFCPKTQILTEAIRIGLM